MEKKFDFPTEFPIAITCASGVEKVLKSEFKRLYGKEEPVVNGCCTFTGNALDIAKANINLRTADRVYIRLAEFSVTTFDELFDGVKNVPLENYLPFNANIVVDGKCVKSKLFAISACQSIIKKAIAVRLCEKYKLNSLSEDGATYEIHFSVFKDVVSLFLNTSGIGLHKRGYRDLVGIAPIKETLASALFLLSDAYYKTPFLDPFCGSGTIAIEGAKIALNIAPNINRKFAFNEWNNFDGNVFNQAFCEAKDKEQRDREIEFFASDIDKKAIALATHHAESAGLKGKIKFEVKDVKYVKNPLSFGTIVTNPPYGERVYDRKEAEECYKGLRELYNGLDRWSLFVITSHNGFERYFGKRADRERKLYNSNKECKLYYYYADKEKTNDRR